MIPLHNLTIFVTPMKRVDFSEVTGVRALKKSPASVRKYELCKGLNMNDVNHET